MRRQKNVATVAGISAGVYIAAAVGVWAIYKLSRPSTGVEGLGALGGPRIKRVKARRVRRAGKVDRRTRKVIAKPMNGLEGLGDVGLGDLGFSLKKAVKSVSSAVQTVAAPVTQVVKTVAAPVTKVVQKATPMVTKVVGATALAPLKISREVIRPIAPLNKLVGGTMDKPLTAVDKAAAQVGTAVTGGPGPVPSGTTVTPGAAVTQYQDANGNPITEAQYNELMAHINDPIYQDANGNVITKEQYDALMAEYNASLLAPPPVSAPSPAPVTGGPGPVPNTPAPYVPPVVQRLPTALDPTAMVQGGSGASSQVYSNALPSSYSSGSTSYDSGAPTAPTVSTPQATDSGAAPAPAGMSAAAKVGALIMIPLAIGFMNKDG